MKLPNNANRLSSAAAVRQARAAIARHFSGESPPVIARKTGTTAIGSTMRKTAGMASMNVESIQMPKRSFHTTVKASRKIFRLIFD